MAVGAIGTPHGDAGRTRYIDLEVAVVPESLCPWGAVKTAPAIAAPPGSNNQPNAAMTCTNSVATIAAVDLVSDSISSSRNSRLLRRSAVLQGEGCRAGLVDRAAIARSRMLHRFRRIAMAPRFVVALSRPPDWP